MCYGLLNELKTKVNVSLPCNFFSNSVSMSGIMRGAGTDSWTLNCTVGHQNDFCFIEMLLQRSWKRIRKWHKYIFLHSLAIREAGTGIQNSSILVHWP